MPDQQTPTADDLREQIADAEQAITDAQVELGQATLDGKSAAAPTKAMQDAQAQIARARAALDELTRRETDAAYREQLAAASARRQAEYEWAAEFSRRAEAMLLAQQAALEAEDALLELRRDPASRRFKQCKIGISLDSESVDLDADLVDAVPEFPPSPGRVGTRVPIKLAGGRFTAGRAREVRELAETRAREEAAGQGVDFSGVPSSRIRELLAGRAARRAQREADRA